MQPVLGRSCSCPSESSADGRMGECKPQERAWGLDLCGEDAIRSVVGEHIRGKGYVASFLRRKGCQATSALMKVHPTSR